ncbi:tRNA 2-thiouridine(34) synthase MnmA [Feifania hominis]|uniref:tRNA-specific 2-thiouridylase MnmA n=1 Tax=Feifania hominis TaxID=2763660 RepID=A0A926DEX1_9FIRM|nr:tRNA 2-thiouridine(34) synthase MnmA [Feifania hominis]MBC8536592.1 tRNA 2-thiouridine(34) synthase MnmA [Feifania hominis]
MNQTVVLGLSGGVDSSVAAGLLQQAGFDVVGVMLQIPHAASPVDDARRVAAALDIPLITADVAERFEKYVIAPFAAEYRAGRTPNPCVVCNPSVKFHTLLSIADDLGAEYVATGHYARVARAQTGGRHLLLRAANRQKDQSYMLYRLGQDVLARLLLPLAELDKQAVRALAGEQGLVTADKPDSQEICFVPDGDHAAFLERHTGASPAGDFVDGQGCVLGRHRGVIRYTVGQRKGLGVSLGYQAFVSAIDAGANTVTLTADERELFHGGVTLTDCVFHPFERLDAPMRVTAKIRFAAREAAALATPLGGGAVRVDFDEPQRAPAPGQSCVLYDGDTVVGGGFIR